MMTFRDVIDAFDGPTRFAAAIGIEPFHAQTMKNRGSIPPAYWTRVVEAAAREDKNITYETLAQIAARRQEAA